MLFTITVNLIKESFLKNTDRVHFIKKIKDLLLTDFKV